ncbi:hypothetical protein EV122DRAFT_201305 [Schizophyllum commune]
MSTTENAKSTLQHAESAVISELKEASTLAKDVALSGGYLYPLHGIYYFATHPSLYRSVAPVIYKTLLTSAGVTAGMFFFTYLPQVAFCAFFSGPLAFVAAAVMVLGESYAIILTVTKTFLLGTAQDKLFDAVLVQKGREHLVANGREISTSSGGIKKLGKVVTQPLNRFSKEGLLRYIVSLPLNSLPVVGTVLFLLYNGRKAGPAFHARYFQLKKFSATARTAFIERYRAAYTGFGAAALALNLIPVVGLAFSFTTTVGAALWAADLEKKDGGSATAEPEVSEVEM